MKIIATFLLALVTLGGAFNAMAEDLTPAPGFPLKSHHAKLGLTCQSCHTGDDPVSYKRLKTNDCLACHGSAQKVANRTHFMDQNHTNPHNSLHDKLDLDCYECHAEHKPSQNLCQTCHDNTRDWFGPTP